ncbi:NUDIX hydrolase [Humidisolicoccus flavus]|uniref:NUDIX hydrolase n=1 Tax=Humidisolicoccus flavus TaxID=3111414 RepID=UPI003245C13D
MSTPAWDALTERVLAEFAAWAPRSDAHIRTRARYLEQLHQHGAAFVEKAAMREHITASCFLLSPDRSAVLLALHRKANRWLQLGGHLEIGDTGAASAALREAVEEGGVHDISLIEPTPMDLDIHELRGDFTHCAVHWDIGFLAVAATRSVPLVSEESLDVRWWTLHELDAADQELAARLRRMLHQLPAT